MSGFAHRLISLVKRSQDTQPEPAASFTEEFTAPPLQDVVRSPFIKVPCSDCGGMLVWDEPVIPGTVAVIRCTCGVQWAAVAPRIYFVHADELDLNEDQRLD
jgi:hypothetical protein